MAGGSYAISDNAAYSCWGSFFCVIEVPACEFSLYANWTISIQSADNNCTSFDVLISETTQLQAIPISSTSTQLFIPYDGSPQYFYFNATQLAPGQSLQFHGTAADSVVIYYNGRNGLAGTGNDNYGCLNNIYNEDVETTFSLYQK